MDSKRKQQQQQRVKKDDGKTQGRRTAWHRRTSSVNSKDPHTAIQMLVRKLELI